MKSIKFVFLEISGERRLDTIKMLTNQIYIGSGQFVTLKWIKIKVC